MGREPAADTPPSPSPRLWFDHDEGVTYTHHAVCGRSRQGDVRGVSGHICVHKCEIIMSGYSS